MSSSQTSSSSSDAPAHPLSGLLDIVCGVDIVVGSGTLTVRECLRLERHSILALTQTAGSDLQIRVNGVPIASGEVVIIDNSTALRVSHVLPPPGAEAAE